MGALPNKKLTRARKGNRFAHYKLQPVYASQCPQCRSAKLSHRACRNCGYYKGRQVIGGVES